MGLFSNNTDSSVKNLYGQQQQNINSVIQDNNSTLSSDTSVNNNSVSTSSLIDSASSLLSTIGSVWNSTNNVKAAKIKVETLSGELDILKATNDGKSIDLKAKELALEQTKLEEATKLEGYSLALKITTVVSLMVIAITYIKNPFKRSN